MDDPILHFNGLDALTGDYALRPMTTSTFVERLGGRRAEAGKSKGVRAGVTPADVASAGWTVALPAELDPAIREALGPLLRHRERQATSRGEEIYKELLVRYEDSVLDVQRRHDAAPGPVDPRKIPYYVLLVGGPDQISYDFEQGLAVQHAVGRLHLETADEVARYAETVIAAETAAETADVEVGDVETGDAEAGERQRRMTLFGVLNPGDPATESSLEHLILPLLDALPAVCPGWRVEGCLGEVATKDELGRLLGGDATPALLMTAGHALLFPNGHERQAGEQGALVTSDWPGPKAWRGPFTPGQFFAAHDLAESADLAGAVTFHFGCFSAGTPAHDAFATNGRPSPLAPGPFTSLLPRRLLAQGAQAVVGHVERAWLQAFLWEREREGTFSSQTVAFESTLQELAAGVPVGHALRYFGERYAELSARIWEELPDVAYDRLGAFHARLWTAHRDARGYVILGDPAVRVPGGSR